MKIIITLMLVLTGLVCTASAKTYTVTFIDGKGWGNVKVRMYNSENGTIHNAAHPGEAMTQTGTRMVNGIALNVYTYTITSDNTFDKLYFVSQDGNHQSDNLDYEDEKEFLFTADRTVFLYDNLAASWENPDPNYQSIGVWDATNSQDVFQFTINAASLSSNQFIFRPKASDQDYQISPDATKGKSHTFDFSNGQWESYDGWSNNGNYKSTVYSFIIDHPNIKASKYIITVYIKYEDGYWKYTTKAEIATMPLEVSSYGVSTFCCNRALDFSAVSGITASAITNADRTTGVLTKASKSKVPASTGLLIEGEAGTYDVPVIVTSDAVAVGTNLLVGVLENTHITQTTGGGTNYILTNRKKSNDDFVTPDPLKFYLVNDESGNTISAGKAYLQIPSAGGGARESFWFGEESSVSDAVKTSNAENEIFFNLRGQRITQPTKGLYIVNGKKIFK